MMQIDELKQLIDDRVQAAIGHLSVVLVDPDEDSGRFGERVMVILCNGRQEVSRHYFYLPRRPEGK